MGDDMVTFNVDGTLMTTTRSTLSHIHEHYRNSCFDRETDDRHIFVDFDPTHFAIVLNYLRRKSFSSSEVLTPSSKVAPEEIESFVKLVEHLGLSNTMQVKTSERFEFGSILKDDDAVATTQLKRGAEGEKMCRAVGWYSYNDGVFSIKLKFEKMRINDGEAKVGMIVEDLYDKSDDTCLSRALYGWGFCSNQLKMYSNTMRGTHEEVIAKSRESYDALQGKIVELILDCNAAKLYINTPDGEQYYVELPKWSKYKLKVNATSVDDFQVRIVDSHKGR